MNSEGLGFAEKEKTEDSCGWVRWQVPGKKDAPPLVKGHRQRPHTPVLRRHMQKGDRQLIHQASSIMYGLSMLD